MSVTTQTSNDKIMGDADFLLAGKVGYLSKYVALKIIGTREDKGLGVVLHIVEVISKETNKSLRTYIEVVEGNDFDAQMYASKGMLARSLTKTQATKRLKRKLKK